jgi:hypothetical protein
MKIIYFTLGVLLFLGIVAVVLGIYYYKELCMLIYIGRHQGPGKFDRSKYEAIVRNVKAFEMKAGEKKLFKLNNFEDPNSIQALPGNIDKHGTYGPGLIWAEKTNKGLYKIVIRTRDLGHAGEYGFAYSDTLLTATSIGNGWSTIPVPGHINLVTSDMKIDDNWWKVVFNLD